MPKEGYPAHKAAVCSDHAIFPDFIGVFCVSHGEMDQMDQMDHQKSHAVQAKGLKGLLAVCAFFINFAALSSC
jgi:hypothetical protein